MERLPKVIRRVSCARDAIVGRFCQADRLAKGFQYPPFRLDATVIRPCMMARKKTSDATQQHSLAHPLTPASIVLRGQFRRHPIAPLLRCQGDWSERGGLPKPSVPLSLEQEGYVNFHRTGCATPGRAWACWPPRNMPVQSGMTRGKI